MMPMDGDEERMFLSSLPMWVDVGDWLHEDLPTLLGGLPDPVPGKLLTDGHQDGYSPVTSDGGTGAAGRDRVLTVIVDDDESGWQLAGGI
jgi:hypothetical protein